MTSSFSYLRFYASAVMSAKEVSPSLLPVLIALNGMPPEYVQWLEDQVGLTSRGGFLQGDDPLKLGRVLGMGGLGMGGLEGPFGGVRAERGVGRLFRGRGGCWAVLQPGLVRPFRAGTRGKWGGLRCEVGPFMAPEAKRGRRPRDRPARLPAPRARPPRRAGPRPAINADTLLTPPPQGGIVIDHEVSFAKSMAGHVDPIMMNLMASYARLDIPAVMEKVG
jgi:hypothetical protein